MNGPAAITAQDEASFEAGLQRLAQMRRKAGQLGASASKALPGDTVANAPAAHAPFKPAAHCGAPEVELKRGDTFKAESVAWLWHGYLALGKLHILAGSPGTGKTTIALTLAATVTNGGQWPDSTRAPVGDVLIWSSEDAIADTLVPRLRAAGADMTRVHFVDTVKERNGARVSFDPSAHFPALAVAASALPELRLVIVDPIVSAVTGDSHKNAEVRRALQPIVDFANKQQCAVIGITHYTKGTQGREPWERVTGSLGFAALARIVLCTAKMSNPDASSHVIVRAKTNIGQNGGGFCGKDRQGPLLHCVQPPP